jgi:hypothetical protein
MISIVSEVKVNRLLEADVDIKKEINEPHEKTESSSEKEEDIEEDIEKDKQEP